jgi:hypothetical protein
MGLSNMEISFFSLANPLFLWPFSIAMLNYQRVVLLAEKLGSTTGCWQEILGQTQWIGQNAGLNVDHVDPSLNMLN